MRTSPASRLAATRIALRATLVALTLAIVPVAAQRPVPAPPPGAQPGGAQSDPNAVADANAVVDASKTTVPADNSDLTAITERAKAISAMAAECTRARCPIMNCAQAARQYQALVDADTYLDAMVGALNRAAADSAAAHANVVAQTRITSTNLEIAQEALAVKEYLYRLATTLFDLASVMDDFKNMAQKGTILPGDNLLQKLDTAYETLKDVESLAGDAAKTTNDIANAASGTNVPTPNTSPMTSATGSALGVADSNRMSMLNDLKSNASDAANAFDTLRQQVKDGALDKNPEEVLANLSKAAGKVAFRALKVKVEKEMADLQKQIDDLLANLSAEEKVVAGLFVERMRIGARRNAAEDALSAVRAAKEALGACLARACGMPSVSRPRLPDYYAVPPGTVLGDRAGRVGWGRALRDLNGKIADVRGLLGANVALVDRCPPDDGYFLPPLPSDDPSSPPPPKTVVETNCPACADIALQLARTFDEIATLNAEKDRIERNLARARDLRERLRIAERRLADLDSYLRALRDIIREAQVAGFSVAGEGKQNLTLAEARRVELLGELTYLRREIERLESERVEPAWIASRLHMLGIQRQELRRMLTNCERTACKVQVDTVVNIIGNNPFDAQNPSGSTSTFIPSQCSTPQPPADTRTQSCPAGQSGTIVQVRTYLCIGGSWVPGPFETTANTCQSPQPSGCTAPQPPTETQTLPCPSGQTGSIIQSRSYSCVGTNWVAGPFQTVSNSCTTPAPTGCATNFSSGAYSCSGACGIGSTNLTVNSGSNAMTANPFGANSNVTFNCLGSGATSQSNNLIILGAPNHTCSLNAFGLTSFGINCRNTSGGTCSSSCSR